MSESIAALLINTTRPNIHSNYGTFLLVICMNLVINTKQTLYLRHRKNELRKNKSGHSCSQRAQLLSVTLHWLRGQKLAEKLFF
jgi:hypothetical protein